jgi:hypothetical protein
MPRPLSTSVYVDGLPSIILSILLLIGWRSALKMDVYVSS